MHIVKIEKEKTMLLCTNSDGKTYGFNLKTREIIGLRGKPIKTRVFSYCNVAIPGMNYDTRHIISTILNFPIEDPTDVNLEIAYIYANLVRSVTEVPETIPSGFITFLKKNKLKLTKDNLAKFNFEKQIQNTFTRKEVIKIRSLMHTFGVSQNLLVQLSPNQLKTILKILDNNLADYSIRKIHAGQLTNFIEAMLAYSYVSFDITKDFFYNKKLLEEYENAFRQEKIQKNQEKIKALSQIFVNDEFTIVIPLTQEQFTDEGQQQHNCVGYYYHYSIAEGKDLIYFLRKKENPEKSFITCRFNIFSNCTVERKRFANKNITPLESEIIHEQIDPLIRNILSKAES